MQPTVYQPMEIAAREMDSRLLIALFAVNAGMDVVMGQKWLLQKNVNRLPPGVWIFKTLTQRDGVAMQEARAAGNYITAIDEEIPGLGEGCGGLKWVMEGTLKYCDSLFCLGEAHKQALEQIFPQHKDANVVTGNPRWDLLRPELRRFYGERADEIRQDLGRFILVNTNVGLMNSAKGSSKKLVGKLYKAGKIDQANEGDLKFIQDLEDFENANLKASISLTRKLARALPDIKVVLRPHPTEKIETYQKALAGIDNITILSGGSAAPWILASELLIHTSCTTGVEAFGLEKPSICFESIPSPLHDYFLSASLGRRTSSEEDVLKWAKDLIGGTCDYDWQSAEKTKIFHKFYAGQSGPNAAETIVDHIVAQIDPSEKPADGWKPKPGFKTWNWRTEYQKRIYPNVKPEVLRDKLHVFAQLTGMRTPDVTRIGRAIYHLK